MDDALILHTGRSVLELSSQSIARTSKHLDHEFCRAVNTLYATKGNIIVSGIGKSGIIAKKIAATLTSTGTFSAYIHPNDAFHGDFGMIKRDDTLLIFSHSGETEELLSFLTVAKKIHGDNPVVCITSKAESSIAKLADVVVLTLVTIESLDEDFKYIPTTSTSVTLALGDALAIALQKKKGFKITHFLDFHPGGAIGKHASTI